MIWLATFTFGQIIGGGGGGEKWRERVEGETHILYKAKTYGEAKYTFFATS